LADGPAYRNRGVHIVKMLGGKVVEIDAHEDSQAVSENLARQAALGVAEATAAPIVS
jgi:ketosteroid isomerase-like protein